MIPSLGKEDTIAISVWAGQVTFKFFHELEYVFGEIGPPLMARYETIVGICYARVNVDLRS